MNDAVVGLVGVLVGVGISWIKDWLSSKQSRKGNARFLAINVVCVLDQYTDQCAEVVRDDGRYHGQRHPDGILRTQVPPPPDPIYPTNVDWTSINQDLMYRALSLPNEAMAAANLVDFMFSEIAGPPDYEEGFEERQFQYAHLGLLALEVAKDLRKAYKIPQRNIGNWKPEESLRKKKAEIEKLRIDRYSKPPSMVLTDDN